MKTLDFLCNIENLEFFITYNYISIIVFAPEPIPLHLSASLVRHRIILTYTIAISGNLYVEVSLNITKM